MKILRFTQDDIVWFVFERNPNALQVLFPPRPHAGEGRGEGIRIAEHCFCLSKQSISLLYILEQYRYDCRRINS